MHSNNLNSQNEKIQFKTDKNISEYIGNWENLVKNLTVIAPGYAKYLGYLITLVKSGSAASSSTKPKSSLINQQKDITLKEDQVPEVTLEEVEQCIMKISHVVNLFFCGGYIEHEMGLTESTLNTNSENSKRILRPFKFGLNSIVRDWETLGKFITSHVTLKIFEQYWPEPFINKVKSGNNIDFSELDLLAKISEEDEPGSPKNNILKEGLLEIIGRGDFLSVIGSVVDFACRGKAMTLPNYQVKTKVFGGKDKTLKEMAKNWIVSSICGWYPSDRDAHSLVLMGGTGSGKSSVAQSGIVALSDSLSQFGYSLFYPGPVDEVIFDFYHDNHYKGEMPDATEEGARYTLTLGLQPIIVYSGVSDPPIPI